nr:FAD-dependent oxidoreductase [Desulfosoma caldarium]
MARSPEEFRAKQNIQVHIGHEVIGIDSKARRIEVVDRDSGRLFREPYDDLLIATGARPIIPEVPGREAQGVFGVSTLESGLQVRRAVDVLKPRCAVVVGGGYIGLEMAEAFLLLGLKVRLIEKAPQVMGTLDPDMAALVAEALVAKGVQLHLEESLMGFETKGGAVTSVVTDKGTYPASIVVLGLGVQPNTEMAAQAGVPLGIRGALKVNARMACAVDGIWGAGDCAESTHFITSRPFYVALGTVANRHGRVAGTNIAGGHAVMGGVLGTAVTKICSIEIGRTGLQERELQDLGWDYVTETIESRTKAGYFPGSGPIRVKLLADRKTGKILGGQIVGEAGSAKRIDVVAAAIMGGLTAEAMSELDLGYAPPFSPLWDPVIIAARALSKKVG